MKPWLTDPDVQLFHGDALTVLRGMDAGSVDCVATSPPFFGLRDYQVEGQIGLEETPDEWVERLVGVFAEARRVMSATATLWIECGDSYSAGAHPGYAGASTSIGAQVGRDAQMLVRRPPAGTKSKDLLGTPWVLAFALRADGWWLRQAIIWHKPNAMPESAKDRCTTAHSYVFLLSKSARYHFDADAIAEPAAWERWGDQTVPKYEGTDTASGWMQPKTKDELRKRSGLTGGAYSPPGQSPHSNARLVNPGNRSTNGSERTDEMRGFDERLHRADGLKNARSVWTIPTRGYPDAHFATWPEALVERILKAGCPEGGTILDPFVGSGTTCAVARKHGRRSIGIDLSEPYLELAAKRLQQLSLLSELSA